jgi:hypothetical protein
LGGCCANDDDDDDDDDDDYDYDDTWRSVRAFIFSGKCSNSQWN